MASLFELGEIKKLRITKKGMRAMMRQPSMQAGLFGFADEIAQRLNAANDGTYAARPIGEPVTSKVGAHAFVITDDIAARNEQALYDTLNEAL